ncbi:hypothetical protein HPP92_013910 [Vanilla planifolia]|uniref:Uncharacterized protein n=1 Tax=Vanilla planifolia TaxID=51239 RepID=A0A835QZW6_VANPL|nr:hypothetical protein HPP92_014294 [Vanilla planifolia]KAG0479191.1 hypothetical protein HPP92_013910 [Vanilla planifolia]
MVVPKNPKAWLSDRQHRVGDVIGILAFEAAAAMARLVSLHRSLSDAEVIRLRSDGMRSRGVAYLTSTDQLFLFRLACAELVSDLDAAAATVSRLAVRCRANSLLSFPSTYADVKAGCAATSATAIRALSIKGMERRVKQMEKRIATVEKLVREMEAFDEMEAAEKRMAMKFGRHSGPIPLPSKQQMMTVDAQLLFDDIKAQRKRVARLREGSLWNRTFDEVVAVMSRSVFAVFARICLVFGPFVTSLPPVLVSSGRMSFTPFSRKFRIYPRIGDRHHSSGPVQVSVLTTKEVAIRNSCPIIGRGREEEPKLPRDCKKVLQPAESTLGGAGLAILYANLVVTAERLMKIGSREEEAEEGEVEAAREEIYRLLPERMRVAVRWKLKERWRERGLVDSSLAQGWREAVERILRWLGPVARDTVKWHDERMLDRSQRLNTKPRVLALQTLRYSDKDKAEAAIIEVLVGLSCFCWYESRRNSFRP